METICVPSFKPISSIHHLSRKLHSNRRNSTICFCAANHDEAEEHKRKQELLVKIAMLQTQKVRLTDFLDERSAYLTQFAQDADAEFDQIGEGALNELDQASDRIMENLDRQMQTFQESAEINKREIEKGQKELEDFEEIIQRDRNEGLFFKNLRDKKHPQKKEEAKMKAQKLTELTKKTAGSAARKSVYMLFMALLGAAITTNSVITFPQIEWKKTLVLVLLFLALLAQYIYETRLSTEAENTDKNK